jgi:hypothetical protein
VEQADWMTVWNAACVTCAAGATAQPVENFSRDFLF